jgi:hypothetical protein
MYEVYWCDLGSDPNADELITFDDLKIALDFSVVRILFSSFISCASIWEVDPIGSYTKRKKVHRVFWQGYEVTIIDPFHPLWTKDVLLSLLHQARGSGADLPKRTRR